MNRATHLRRQRSLSGRLLKSKRQGFESLGQRRLFLQNFRSNYLNFILLIFKLGKGGCGCKVTITLGFVRATILLKCKVDSGNSSGKSGWQNGFEGENTSDMVRKILSNIS